MTLKQWLLLQNLLAPSSENVDAQNTQTDDTANQTGDTSTVNEGEKLFTQDEVNKVVSKRVKEIKTQFKDYDELKETVTKLTDQVKKFQDETKALNQKYLETTYTSAVEKAAQSVNLDVDLAMKHIDKDKVIFVDDKPTNLVELLQAEIEKFPQLVKKPVVTPTVATTTATDEPKFSLHNKPNTSKFFSGGGLRLNHVKQDA